MSKRRQKKQRQKLNAQKTNTGYDSPAARQFREALKARQQTSEALEFRKKLEASRDERDKAEFRKSLELSRRPLTLELAVKPPEPLTIEEKYQTLPPEGQYQVHVNMIHEIYAKYALKDITTMSPEEKEHYRFIMDRVRQGRGLLESNLPVEQKLAELTVRFGCQ
jgi:hypothetical protein